jgi:MEMO1 family protein
MADDRPRLRQLDIFPVVVDGENLVCLRDPSGLSERAVFLPRAGAVAALLCDGQRTTAQVAEELGRRANAQVSAAQIDELVGQLDECLFLIGARLEAHRRIVLEDFHAAPSRAPSHAGNAYAGEPEALRAAIADWDAQIAAEAAPPPLRSEAGAPAMLVSPHIDYHRGGLTYARAWRAAGRPRAEPFDLVVIFGTDHNGTERPFTLTRKTYDTPLGPVATDVPLVDELVARLPVQAEALFADELNHRHEHSIELQAVWLRSLFGDAGPPVLPVLCGSLHRSVERQESPGVDPRVAGFLDALRTATAGRRVLVVAGADLAHVGPRFGDGPMKKADCDRVAGEDHVALEAAARRDADAFFAAVAAVGDRNRVCGLAPIYHAVAFAGREGRPGTILDYDQCRADEAGASFVSITALAM